MGGHLLAYVSANQPTKLLEPFLIPQAATVNAEALFSEPIHSASFNLIRNSFFHFPTPLVLIPTHFPRFCLCNLENGSHYFGM